MNKVNIGIVGLGAIARKAHIPVLSSFKDVKIESVAEINPKRSEKFIKKWNISQIYTDYSEMYSRSDLDAVFICAPNFIHFNAVKSAIEHGLHVFCEKPMGTSSDDAFELVKMAEKKNVVLAVGYNRRLVENYEKAHNAIKSLKLGRSLQAHAILVDAGPYIGWIPHSDWFFQDKYGVLYDLGSHLVDLILYVLSDQITEVSALGINTFHGVNIYDNITCCFITEKGTTGTFNIGWRIPQGYNEIEVYGTAGSLFANPIEIEIRYGSYDSIERVANLLKFARKNIRSKPFSQTYVREDRAFIDAIRNNIAPLVKGEEALKVLEVLDAIKESLRREGRRIKVCFHK